MAPDTAFHFETKNSGIDEAGNKATKITCHGRLVAGTSASLNDAVKPLISLGGRIIIDLGDVSYLDSSGLGTLVSLKVSAIRQGFGFVEFVEMTPRVLELLHITNLMQLFSS